MVAPAAVTTTFSNHVVVCPSCADYISVSSMVRGRSTRGVVVATGALGVSKVKVD